MDVVEDEEVLPESLSSEELDESLLSDDRSLEEPSESLLLSSLKSFTLQRRKEMVQCHEASGR